MVDSPARPSRSSASPRLVPFIAVLTVSLSKWRRFPLLLPTGGRWGGGRAVDSSWVAASARACDAPAVALRRVSPSLVPSLGSQSS